ncbi:MAG: RNA-directed DNA polymerase [Planctomycetes bacterium]|nr:RNA-directed DNA polymerase [Planctomycetota bacterium]
MALEASSDEKPGSSPERGDPIALHRAKTFELARALTQEQVYQWLFRSGYFPESYVLPPCFAVARAPNKPRQYYPGKKLPAFEWINVYLPRSTLTDRRFGIMHPQVYSDIALDISKAWPALVDAMMPTTSSVTSYGFPIPLDAASTGRPGKLRAGRMIYEFLDMTEDDIASVACQYEYVVKADIKNFYPSVYTHSIAWAIHGKAEARAKRNDLALLGNRLDRLFQQSNDGCTNGIPIGPAVSDVVAEVLAAAVDVSLSQAARKEHLEFEAVRFKDDYRILVKSEAHARAIVKLLQGALRQYNLELSDEKTRISVLPDGLFREWVSRYYAVHPERKDAYSWKDFRELYLAVLQIDRACPGTGVVDRFLADITTSGGRLKVDLSDSNLQKIISMLFMLAKLRIKAFPKVVAIVEQILRSDFGKRRESEIVRYLVGYLEQLCKNADRNTYLISWIAYFLSSNDLMGHLGWTPMFADPIAGSILENRAKFFEDAPDFELFVDCREAGRRTSMFDYLAVFSPPKTD